MSLVLVPHKGQWPSSGGAESLLIFALPFWCGEPDGDWLISFRSRPPSLATKRRSWLVVWCRGTRWSSFLYFFSRRLAQLFVCFLTSFPYERDVPDGERAHWLPPSQRRHSRPIRALDRLRRQWHRFMGKWRSFLEITRLQRCHIAHQVNIWRETFFKTKFFLFTRRPRWRARLLAAAVPKTSFPANQSARRTEAATVPFFF